MGLALMGLAMIKGFSDGFSSFVGLSLSNSMWIADYDSEYNITNEELVYFRAGDCLILSYDTLHAGANAYLSSRIHLPLAKVESRYFASFW
jgi:hypothetical protein